VTYAVRYPLCPDEIEIELVGTETEKPFGAEMLSENVDDEQPESLLMIWIEYVIFSPGVAHEPVWPQDHVLSG